MFIPFKNNVFGLAHNNIMTVQTQAKILPCLIQIGNIVQRTEKNHSAFFRCTVAGFGNPAIGTVFTQNTVFIRNKAFLIHLLVGQVENLLPVIRMNQAQITVRKNRRKFIVSIAEQI